MCGICGFNFEDKDLLKKMCNLIKHRGPDDVGYFTNSEVSIGMRRLSIIDLKLGHQPQHNENEDIWIVFNGEIYNFLSLKQILENNRHKFYTDSDTEVIIHAYEEWGEKCVNMFRGQFAFCIYDSSKQIFFLARDHFGIIPLYYFFNEDSFIFGSEIKCILINNIRREMDKNAFNLYLSLRYVPFNFTLFKKIYKVPPSSYLIYDLKNKSMEIKKYWEVNFKVNRMKTEDILAKELRNLLEESVKIRLMSEVPLGAFLSGGIDSSIVVALMSKNMTVPVKTFSIGFERGAPVNETKYAKLVSDFYNTDHTELTIKSTCYEVLPQLVWHFDDLIADPAIVPVYFMSKLASERITVALTGDGADEIFAGYSIYYKTHVQNYMKFVPKQFYTLLSKFYNYTPSQTFRLGISYLNLSRTELDRLFRGLLYIPDEEKNNILPYKVNNVKNLLMGKLNKKLDIINQFIDYDLKFQLPNQYNIKTDRMSMAASLEARVPYLDSKFVKWSLTIPPELKLKGFTEKYILRLAMKDLLPPQILKRKKLGFGTPMNMWFKTGLKEVSEEILERLGKRKYLINTDYVKTINKNRFKRIYENRTWILLMFELWYETFIENNGFKPIKL